jgi:D-serine dehydratase
VITGADPVATDAVDALLDRVRGATEALDADGCFAGSGEILVSAGGSIFFDRVAALRGRVGALSRPARVLLRSGCYVTHDHGLYAERSPLARGEPEEARLRPALELWSAVLSRPERDLAILGFGRRDAPFDAGLPRPLRVLPPDGGAARALEAAETFALNDQHAFVRLAPDTALAVGDRVVSGISHPCTAFDKWTALPVLDDDDRVVGAVRTLF